MEVPLQCVHRNNNREMVLCFAIEDTRIPRLSHLRDTVFSWRPGKLLRGFKTLPIF